MSIDPASINFEPANLIHVDQGTNSDTGLVVGVVAEGVTAVGLVLDDDSVVPVDVRELGLFVRAFSSPVHGLVLTTGRGVIECDVVDPFDVWVATSCGYLHPA